MFIKRFKRDLNYGEMFEMFCDALKEHSGEIFICDEFMATWWAAMDRIIVVRGDYTKCTEEEVNAIFHKYYAFIAMQTTAHLN
jgi:hypothetical protein